MHDILISDLRQRYSAVPNRIAVEADVRHRLEFGLGKYGKPLRAHNGRDPLLDAYQEILDGLVYLIQAQAESSSGTPAEAARLGRLLGMYEDLVEMAFTLKELMGG